MVIASTSNPLADDFLKDALARVAALPHLPDRIAWWTRHSHADEAWFRDELAFSLSRVYAGAFETHCEGGGNRYDIVVTDASPDGAVPLSSLPTIAAIELKVHGNWYLVRRDVQRWVQQDLIKTSSAPVSAIALQACWHFVPQRGRRSAFADLIRRQQGTENSADLRDIFTAAAGRAPDFQFETDCSKHEDFAQLRLLTFGFLNRSATNGPLGV